MKYKRLNEFWTHVDRCLRFAPLLLFLCLLHNTALANKSHILDIASWRSSENIPVYFVRTTQLPILDIQIIFAAGSAYDKQQAGLAALTNSMLGEGAGQQNADQIAETFDQVGAQFDTDVDRDKAVVTFRSLTQSNYLNAALSELTFILKKTSFPTPALQRVKQQLFAAIQSNAQDPEQIANDAFFRAIYKQHPYAHPILGHTTTLQTLQSRDCQRFYHRYYVTGNTRIVLVGNVTSQHAQQIAEKISAALPKGPPAEPLNLAPSLPKSGVTQHITLPTQQTAITVGQVGIGPDHPDYFPLILGNYLLGGLPLDSILFQQLRNQYGLAYDVNSSFQILRYQGPFMVTLKTRATQTQKALSVLQQSITNLLQTTLSPQTLNAAKRHLTSTLLLSFSNNASISARVADIAFYHRPPNYWDTYVKQLQTVTAKQVTQALRNTLHPKQWVVVTVGPVSH